MILLADPTDPADVPTGYVPPDLAALAAERDAVSADLGARYRVNGFIARGGFASVWEAFDEIENRPVAVKRIHPKVGRGGDFYRELRAMFALESPHVVRIVNFLEAGPTRYLILELCAGGSLRGAISAARRGRGSPIPAAETVRQIAAGLAAAHKLGLTHRDLKPENILFAAKDGGAVKLADFGLASLFARDDGGALKALTGSPAYMAPEQFCGEFGPASDVYALGVIAFELLTGDIPFTGGAEDLAFHHLRTPPAVPGDLPAPWPTLLPAMLAKNTGGRPTADGVAAALAPRAPAPHRRERTSEYEFLLPAADGFDRVTAGGTEFITLPGLTDLVPKPGGAWCVAGPAVGEWEHATGLLRLGELPPGVTAPVVFESDGRVLAAWLKQDEFTVFDVTGGTRVWSRAVPCGGLRPKVARLPDGTIACTDFNGGPGLRFLSATGDVTARVPLPGICWQLAAWANGGCAARLLTGSGFHAFRVSPRGARALPLGKNVTALATDATGRVAVGVRGDGTVTAWEPGRAVRAACARPRTGEVIRGAATDGRAAAVAWSGEGGTRVAVVEPE